VELDVVREVAGDGSTGGVACNGPCGAAARWLGSAAARSSGGVLQPAKVTSRSEKKVTWTSDAMAEASSSTAWCAAGAAQLVACGGWAQRSGRGLGVRSGVLGAWRRWLGQRKRRLWGGSAAGRRR
jgi:hypothetical protein